MAKLDSEIPNTDLLVIGGGLAGARAVVEAKRQGLSVILTQKGKFAFDSNSAIASGGFATSVHPNDGPERHIEDALRGGYGINDLNILALVCHRARENLESLDALLGGFPRKGGIFEGDAVPAHSFPRSVRYPAGMQSLMNALNERLVADETSIFEHHRVVDLLQDQLGAVIGGLFYDSSTDSFRAIIARKTILATGGCGNIFPVTSNSSLITGDGSAVAIRAGCDLRDMEFIQYTPTAFAAPEHLRGHTINGALLAINGVHLLNSANGRFMAKYAPETMERSNRAVVARSIYREISSGRGTEAGGVYMNLTSVPFEQIDTLRPGFTKFCMDNGIDPGAQPLQTAPSVHTCLGGVSVNSDLTAKPNLYVVGEAIGGTHGANRLSSNSLSEANVTGWFAANNAFHSIREDREYNADIAVRADKLISRIRKSHQPAEKTPGTNRAKADQLIDDLQTVMGESAGIERSHEGLSRGLERLLELSRAHRQLKFPDTDDLASWLDLRNMIETSQTILHSALARKESRGAHLRTDFPEQDDKNWLGNILISRNKHAANRPADYSLRFKSVEVPVTHFDKTEF